MAGLVLCLYGVGLVVYRLTLHPLARFPGPKLAAATQWLEFYYDVLQGHGGQYASQIEKMHDRYGPIVRINPNEIHVRDSSYYSTIYAVAPAKRDKYRPAAEMIGIPLGTFGTVEHEVHRKRRQANSVYFSKRAMVAAQDIVYEQVDILCDNLRASHQQGTVLRGQLVYLPYTTDSTTSYLFGRSLGYLSDEKECRKWHKTTSALNRVTPIIKQFPWIPQTCFKIPESLLLVVVPPLGRVVSMLSMCLDEAGKHRAGKTGKFGAQDGSKDVSSESGLPPTLFHAIDESGLPDHEKSVPRLAQEAFVFLAAGADTAARILTSLTHRLLTHPEVLEKLRKDLSTVMSSADSKPTLKDIEGLHYFRACIKEELRLIALLTSRLPLVAPEPLTYKEWTIPPHTAVSMTIKDVSMDPEIFAEPRKYNPDRWLKDGELHRDLDAYFVAFGKGPRMCQGMDFGYTMLYLAACQVFMKFDLELHDTIKERDVDFHRDYFFGEPTPGSKGVQIKVVGVRE